ncbi:MAG: sugar phosphate isomerase/epimerase family protein [Xanthomonadales bacterium]|jgi:sugar phosphate isomerase/epimerase|nr:sugar phosphate isomerase/epimerase family protein [Xanthomonadales bacterium]
MDRRKFIQTAGGGIITASLAPGLLAGDGPGISGDSSGQPALYLFSKAIQFLDYREMAQAAAAMGFSGLDLTVRPGGHVEPDRYDRDLPAAVSAIKDAGLDCEMMVTKIVGTDNRRDYDLLALARSLGIKSYRLGGLKYDGKTSATETVKRYQVQLAELAEWNRRIGITGMYQNHSGEGAFGASIWDIFLAVKDLDPDALGIQFDVRHAVTEGGRNWADGYRLLKPYIRSLAIKDFIWAEIDGKWKLVNTPMGEGMVDFSRYFGMLKESGMDYPVSVHCEYDLGGAEKGRREPAMPREQILAAIRQDVVTIKKLWAEA